VKHIGTPRKYKESLIKFPLELPINRETKIIFYNYDNGKMLFYLWFHSKFVKSNSLKFNLDDLDKPNKKEYTFHSNFSITLIFHANNPSSGQKTRIERTKAHQNRLMELGTLRGSTPDSTLEITKNETIDHEPPSQPLQSHQPQDPLPDDIKDFI